MPRRAAPRGRLGVPVQLEPVQPIGRFVEQVAGTVTVPRPGPSSEHRGVRAARLQTVHLVRGGVGRRRATAGMLVGLVPPPSRGGGRPGDRFDQLQGAMLAVAGPVLDNAPATQRMAGRGRKRL
ncbi:hypothetical protein ACI784_20780 [Geodermatophilus sp. SYSU D01186]